MVCNDCSEVIYRFHEFFILFECFSSSLANRFVVVVASSGCVTEYEFDGASVMVSVEVVGPEHVFVEGYMMRNKYWVGLVNFY